MATKFYGPMAALLTPRGAGGNLDWGGLEKNVDLLLTAGMSGLVVAGGTGEYTALTFPDRKALFEKVAAFARKRVPLICCVGAARLAHSVALAEHALRAGADALLLPPPHFFRYEPDDLEAFYRQAAQEIPGPILIYDLPLFTSPMDTNFIVRLLESVPNLVGVKDSTGHLDTLQALAQRLDLDVCRILGHDGVLARGLRLGCLEAVISGPGGVVPELHVALFRSHELGHQEQFRALADLLDEILLQLNRFPYPWALKLLAQSRGLFPAEFPLPLSERRAKQVAEFQNWYRDWWPRCEREVGQRPQAPERAARRGD